MVNCRLNAYGYIERALCLIRYEAVFGESTVLELSESLVESLDPIWIAYCLQTHEWHWYEIVVRAIPHPSGEPVISTGRDHHIE